MADFALVTLGLTWGLAALLLSLARATDAMAGDWKAVISSTGMRELEALRKRFDAEQQALDYALERAREAVDPAEVAELLGLGYRLVVGASEDRRQLLRKAALYSRLVSALVPLPPIRPRTFRLRALITHSGAAAVLHYLVVTAAGRYRLRLSVLRRGLGIVAAAIARNARLERGAWDQLEAARSDWSTLSDEMLESFRILVTRVTERPAAIVSPAGR
jgi:hypothetical protein